MSIRTEFFKGRGIENSTIPIDELIRHIDDARKDLLDWPLDTVINIIEKFGYRLLDRTNRLHQKYPNHGIPYIASWCRRDNVEYLLDLTFKNRYCLDRYIQAIENGDREIRAFPKGNVVHWLAGNVPTLGYLSLLMGILTKNSNIVKLPSNSDDFLKTLLMQLSEIEIDDKFNGHRLLQSVCIIRYDHKRIDIGAAVSRSADLRIMWGRDESIQTIRRLPQKIDTVDVIFPDRTSFIIIGGEYLNRNSNMHRLARRIAIDVSVFEQKACASPHTIFLLTNDSNKIKIFADVLKKAFDNVLITIPKIPPTLNEVSAILNLRAQYDMFHNAWYSKGLEYTILSDDHVSFGPAIGNRVVYLRKLSAIEELLDCMPMNIQTAGIAVDNDEYDKLTNILGSAGVHRFTKLGLMTHFEAPWDGVMLPSQMVRWTSRSRQLV